MKNLTFEELLDKLEKALARIEVLEKENKLLREENAMLRARLNMNSSNSTLPPSSDRFIKKKDRSLRKKSNKTSGGQVGHKGFTLDKIEKPDFVVDLEIDTCPHCKTDLENVKLKIQKLDKFLISLKLKFLLLNIVLKLKFVLIVEKK